MWQNIFELLHLFLRRLYAVLRPETACLFQALFSQAGMLPTKRMVEALERGEGLPVDLKDQIIYYVGPTPAKPGQPIGSAGPTTSGRMDAYAPTIMKYGLRGMIGKGYRSQEVVEAMKKYNAVYFAATGGAAALIAKAIKTYEVMAYDDLGTEAIAKLTVEDFPANCSD